MHLFNFLSGPVMSAVLSGLLILTGNKVFSQTHTSQTMNTSAIISIQPLSFLWPVKDPFLFCAYHLDHFPKGNDSLGPAASLEGRSLGDDFTIKDGWRMYHGERIPGFPAHPHRGFETITVVKQGLVDHSDSHGQAGRYGNGDVQWMTAGSGLQHCEMFPLLKSDSENTVELFQVWLNLPKVKKMAKPHFKMLWSEDIPVKYHSDAKGRNTRINVIAGSIDGVRALAPAPDSWAVAPENEVCVWTISMQEGAEWSLPPASAGIWRCLYYVNGDSIRLDGKQIAMLNAVELAPDQAVNLVNGNKESFLFLLQGKPIAEPVAQYGPFVMNTREEIEQAFKDYRETEFGGWPWPSGDVVHPREKGRFARHSDGTEETR